jgi:hypothetical protein
VRAATAPVRVVADWESGEGHQLLASKIVLVSAAVDTSVGSAGAKRKIM